MHIIPLNIDYFCSVVYREPKDCPVLSVLKVTTVHLAMQVQLDHQDLQVLLAERVVLVTKDRPDLPDLKDLLYVLID